MQKNKVIKFTTFPDDLEKEIKQRQLKHLEDCDVCKYGFGAAMIAYIRELKNEIKELKTQLTQN